MIAPLLLAIVTATIRPAAPAVGDPITIDFPTPAVVDAFSEQVEEALESPVDFKSLLQERLARRSEIVSYRIVDSSGPPHDRSFVAVAAVSGEELGRGQGKTKKAAEQEAASHALERVEEEWPPEPGGSA